MELRFHENFLKFSYSILIVQRNHVKRQLDENKNTPSERICPIVHILSYNIEDFFFQKWSASLRKIQFVMLFKTNDRILNCIPTFTWHKIIHFYKNLHTNFFSMTFYLFNLFYFFALLAYSNYFYLPLLIQTPEMPKLKAPLQKQT